MTDTQKHTGVINMKTVVEQILDELKDSCEINNVVYMHFESRRAYWMEKAKQEIIQAVEWNYKSNMGEVYYNAKYAQDD